MREALQPEDKIRVATTTLPNLTGLFTDGRPRSGGPYLGLQIEQILNSQSHTFEYPEF